MEAELEIAVQTVRRAGAVVASYFRGAYELREKGGREEGNPVTTADVVADAVLREGIAREFPGDGWLSEETLDSHERLGRRRVWIADPIDGTREFVRGIPEFATSLALIEDGAPRVGVVYNPITQELFAASAGSGTLHLLRERAGLEGARVLASHSELVAGVLAPLVWATLEPVGSIAYKLALLAAGRADAAVSLRWKSEWDVAAGTLLVLEAGGAVTDLQGKPLVFNQVMPGIRGVAAAAPALHKRLVAWFGEHPETLPAAGEFKK